jgi:AraC family transcriptional regulator of adaptative response/methylated-DNA-[protein]-cysteine methyltransferase
VRLKAEDLQAVGVTPERARRWFKEHYGMSFAAWTRGCRLAGAYQQIRGGTSLDDAVFAAGYESHSGFREAFSRLVGAAPGRTRTQAVLVVTSVLDTPLGAMVAAVKDEGLCALEFADRSNLADQLQALQRRFGGAVVPGAHALLDQLRAELREYFARSRREFTLPVVLSGTTFQENVWSALTRIPYGQTISYEELARRIGRPTARRAVALANGMNRIAILVPCHRVIGKDGTLTGYGGGLWRKRLLLQLETGSSA